MEVKAGYKQTEIGVIPEDWQVMPLADLSAFITKGSTPTTYGFNWQQSGVVFLRSECVSGAGLDLGQSMFISQAAHSMLRRSEVCDGDILMTITGNVGRVVMLSGIGVANLNQHIARIRVRAPNADSQYVFHFLAQPSSRRQFGSITTGQAYPQISLQQVRGATIPLPPRPEQRAIAEALSDVDALIGALDQLIAKKRDLKQAAMQQLLTGQHRLPGFRGEWEVKRLGELVEIISGGTPKTNEPSYWNGVIKWCTPTDITGFFGKYLTETARTISMEGLTSCSARLLPVGSLLLCSRATIGEIRIAGCAICTNQGFKSLVCEPGVSNEFLYYKLLTMKSEMVERAIGSTFREISKKETAALKVSVPSLPEQTAIAAVLADMDAELTALEKRRDKTRALKQGMMQELLTGRTRLV